MSDVTILDRLDRQARERPDRPAFSDPRSRRYDAWDTMTWRQCADRTYALARAFRALGHREGDAVSILGPNGQAWVLADLAAMAAGGMPAGIYATVPAEQAQYIARHSGSSIVVAETRAQADKLLAGADTLPKLKAVVLFPGAERGAPHPLLHTWDEAHKRADEVPAATIDELRRAQKPSGLATLIYTSGTTGPPKAVMLSHENLTWTSATTSRLVDPRAGDRTISYLPLSHIAEQMLTIHLPITYGVHVHFLTELTDLPEILRAVRPNSFFGVPRVWEKIQAKIEAGVATAPAHRKRLFLAATSVGLAVNKPKFEGKTPPLLEGLAYPLFDRLVFSKVRARLGLDDARMLATGAAPMSPRTREFFLSLGIPIAEVYGQSEDSGPTSFNKPGEGKLDTVGRPIPGVEVRIAEDGEIEVKGPNVFLGYLHDEEATRAALTPDGFLRSGDVGELDARGFLKITDRKKDLLITAGGKNVAPQLIEKMLVEHPAISQAVVIGDRRKYLTALLTLVPEERERRAKELGVSPEALLGDPRLRAELQAFVDGTVNPKLARFETIKRFELLPRELSEADGELTPTMKIKRKVVSQRFGELIERMYAHDDDARAS